MKTNSTCRYRFRALLFCVVVLASSVPRRAEATAEPVQVVSSLGDTVRFLEQATFGPTPGLISNVQGIGIKAYLNKQFEAALSVYPELPPFPIDDTVGCPEGAPANCFRDNYTMYPLQVQFFLNALNGEDQLRQRVAFALGQIFVISGVTIQQPSSMAPYLNMLNRGAFDNFRKLMFDVTISPAMGRYLDMVNNDRRATGVSPNENYARELLQLFTIGLWMLNQDGTLQLDNLGQPIPTYDQNTVINFARVFTGWTYPVKPGASMQPHNPEYYIGPMVAWENNHDRNAKTLLNGVVAPAGLTAKKDLVLALDNIFNHPNVAPFVCKQLIQHLVTSNPTPAYVGRVSAVFNNNGRGVRGDLGSVVIAILEDPEARGDVKSDPSYGHLRPPVLFITNILRMFNATSDGALLAEQGRNMGQFLFNSPTVFNYYPPTYQVPGAGVLGPEFSIQATSAAIARANFVNTMVFSRINNSGSTGTQIDLSGLQALATNPTALVDELDRLMLHQSMSQAMRNKIVQTVTALPSSTTADRLRRAQWALYLVATSSQYQVER